MSKLLQHRLPINRVVTKALASTHSSEPGLRGSDDPRFVVAQEINQSSCDTYVGSDLRHRLDRRDP